ncbi:response regulator transcription factor [Clostridium isatidis]|uniref:Stage 0 sporulation protein A homolog n=1 Tax=Clostridium isatidis TaxID=182773 RepID=A0A343JAB5_9CLOT|nr:response regulator transcription factor [Clostridium isatidis]ASW42473.1 DNA-binding response regulator [Clostridium isatidis]NLZ34090.1 response regulator transcription factor [Clostridiales bacterium]
MKIKLILADDDVLIRESLKIILSMDKELEIVEVFKNGKEAIDFLLKNNIDIAVLDVRMPLINGVTATAEICKRTNTKVIILTTFDEDDYIKEAIKNGAKGYILKNTPPQKIIETIKMVYEGNAVLQDAVLTKLSENIKMKAESKNKIDKEKFTERELEIMKLIAEGLSNKEISKKLFISEGTVKNYITSIFQKTGLTHRTQIAIYYLKGEI